MATQTKQQELKRKTIYVRNLYKNPNKKYANKIDYMIYSTDAIYYVQQKPLPEEIETGSKVELEYIEGSNPKYNYIKEILNIINVKANPSSPTTGQEKKSVVGTGGKPQPSMNGAVAQIKELKLTSEIQAEFAREANKAMEILYGHAWMATEDARITGPLFSELCHQYYGEYVGKKVRGR